jgi:hypothetical protein
MDLYFHIGLNKSGSTYLQNLLAHNARLLRDEGICVPGIKSNELAWRSQTGNGSELAQFLQRGDMEGVTDWLESTISEARAFECHSIVISSELLFHQLCRAGVHIELYDLCKRLGCREIKYLIFMRSPVQHSISTYNHRANLVKDPFDVWIENSYSLFSELRSFISNVCEQGGRVQFCPYGDKLKGDLEVFLGNVTLEDPVHTSYNRSLSDDEAELVRQYAVFDADVARRLKGCLKAVPVDRKAENAVLREKKVETARRFCEKHSEVWKEISRLSGGVVSSEVSALRYDELCSQSCESQILMFSNYQISVACEEINRIMIERSLRNRIKKLLDRIF